MTFANSRRFNTSAFAIAAALFLGLNGTMLMGFDHIASAGQLQSAEAAQFARTHAAPATMTLERVIITTRRA